MILTAGQISVYLLRYTKKLFAHYFNLSLNSNYKE